MNFFPYSLDTRAYERIMGASKDESFDIRRELREILTEECIDHISWSDTLLNEWNESGCCDLLDRDGIIEDMDSRAIHPSADSSFCREDSDMLISSFDNCLSPGNRHSEDMTTDHSFSLEPAKCMDTRGITGEYHHCSTTVKKFLDSGIRECSYFFPRSTSVGSVFSVHLEDHRYFWEFSLEVLHNELSSESWVEKSENEVTFLHKKIGDIFPDCSEFFYFPNLFVESDECIRIFPERGPTDRDDEYPWDPHRCEEREEYTESEHETESLYQWYPEEVEDHGRW